MPSLALLAISVATVPADAETLTITGSRPASASAQPADMSHQRDIVKMTKAALPALFIDKIGSASTCRFDTSTEALTSLKTPGEEGVVRDDPLPSWNPKA
jgi:hypothetical protein